MDMLRKLGWDYFVWRAQQCWFDLLSTRMAVSFDMGSCAEENAAEVMTRHYTWSTCNGAPLSPYIDGSYISR
jgi:hypothetical protein